MRLFQVDAFTAMPFRGNPAGVVLLDDARPDAWMQAVAAEMNLAETAFLLPGGEGGDLRWFTPAVEVPLCGHATLATAHVLWQTGALPHDQDIAFTTLSGTVRASRDAGGITLDFPAYRPAEAEPPSELAAIVDAPVVGAALIDNLAGDRTWLLELDGDEAVRAHRPDDRALLATGFGGLVLTARNATTTADVVSRCFFPGAGIPEDPVTGAAHCALAPYWAPRLGRDVLVGEQASARGGIVRMRLDGDRVRLGGQAVTVFAGELIV